MKCPECRTEMQSTRGDHVYAESGLPNVVLLNIEIRVCPACGEHATGIFRMEQLHNLIAAMLANKRQRLTGAEIRYLRKHLGFSGQDFAKTIGVDPATVSNWETGKQPMGSTSERLLRLMAVRDQPVESYPNEHLADVAIEDATPTHLSIRANSTGWHAALA